MPKQLLPLYELYRLIRKTIKKEDYHNESLPISEEERNKLLYYLHSSTVKPQDYPSCPLEQSEYFDTLDKCLTSNHSLVDVSATELRNYVHMCYVLSHYIELSRGK